MAKNGPGQRDVAPWSPWRGGGMAMCAVVRRFQVSLPTGQPWVKRAAGRRLDRIDWRGQASRPHRIRRTDASLEDLVVHIRQELKEQSDLGEFGGVAIHWSCAYVDTQLCPPYARLAASWPAAGYSTVADTHGVARSRVGIYPR
jgi:hypothetical protein